MNSRTKQILIFFLVLALVSLACGAGSKATEPAVEPTAAPAEVKPTEPPPTAEPEKPAYELGAEHRYEEGGYTYRDVPGYQIDSGIGIVTMLAEGADPDIGPVITIFGGVPDAGMTNEAMMESFKGQPDTTVSEATPVTVDGHEGLAADITIQRNGQTLVGRIAVVVTPDIQFALLAGGPSDRWDNELGPIFEALLQSTKLFAPTPVSTGGGSTGESPAPTEAPPQGGGMEYISQWASTATASSEWGTSDWAASVATGAPDVTVCDDDVHAWAASGSTTVEWIELYFDTPVMPDQVNIIESYNPDAVVKVELIDSNGSYHEVYTGLAHEISECPYTLVVPVVGADYMTNGVRVTIDQSVINNWTEIDAVQLFGYTQGGAASGGTTGGSDWVIEEKSGLPMLADGELVNSNEELLLYYSNADLATLQDFYLTHLPEVGWLLDIDENGKCRDNDRCMGWHSDYSDPTTTTYFFLQGDHAYLTLNFVQDGSRWQVILSIDPEFE